MGEQDETAGIKCKAHFELGLIRGKWLLIAWAARSYDDLKTAGGMSIKHKGLVSFLGGVAC